MERVSQVSMMYGRRQCDGTCIHVPRRGVNKCMHKRDIDARWGGDEMEEKRNEHRLVLYKAHTRSVEEKNGFKTECAVFLEMHQRPIVIVIVINSRYSHFIFASHDRTDAMPRRTEPH